MGRSSEVAQLRSKVLLEAGVVGFGTVALEVANVRWDLHTTLTAPATLAGHVLFVLAVSHVLMLVFGGRRAREMTRAYAQRQAAQAQLEHRATHDAVTGLGNRDSLQAAMETALDGGPVGLVRLRLQGLEEVTATLGHGVRDLLLAAVARRLEHTLHQLGTSRGGLVASVQSDEYAVLLPAADEVRARAVAQVLLDRLQEPLAVGPALLEVRAAAGVAVAPDCAGTAVDLLGCADVALQATGPGPAGVVVYRPELDRRDASLLNLHGELRRGIAAGELCLHHQPKVDLRTGTVTGVEALVRWQHPTRGLLQPDAFLDLAEQAGLMRELTAAVLDRALGDHVEWARRGRTLPVAVNLSPRCLSDAGLPGQVRAALARHGVDPGQLELEVTESVAVHDPGQALTVLTALRDAGVRVSVDDYGTGHSSLTYLSELPLTTLKIDRSFVQAMESNSRDLTIVRSTIDLGHGLGYRVVAEGIETRAAWEWLQALGCDEAQGYWLARPGAAGQLLGMVAEIEARLGSPVPLPRRAAREAPPAAR